MKFDCGPSDSLLVQVAGYENKSGDTRDYYNPAQASRTLRFQENQEPNVYAGWHHEWGPGSRTLFLAARLVDEVSQDDPAAGIPVIARSGSGTPTFGAVLTPFGQTYSSRLEGYSVEAQHILKTGRNTLIVGARFQDAEVHSSSRQYYDPLNFPPLFFGTANPALSFAGQRPDSALRRVNGYVYDTVEVAESFHLLGGLAYESVDSPANADLPPLSGGEQRVDQWSPKAGFAWRITEANDLRGMYARSLGGTYYESSIRLEPAQLLGFPQAYRSTIPESVVGPVPGTSMDIAALEWTHRSPTRTFVSVRAEGLWSDADRNVGSFDYFPPAAAAQLKQSLDYQEVSLTVAADQLIGAGGVVGIRYRVSEARLDESLTDLPASLPTDGSLSIRQNVKGLLQTLDLHAAYTHSQGWYVGANATLYAQDNDGYTPGLRGDTFWQCNLNAGWWLYRRKARLQLDLLNLTDQDYRLNPLNLHASLPRERTLVVSFKVSL